MYYLLYTVLGSINESLPAGSTVNVVGGSIAATDADTPRADLSFRIAQNTGTPFIIDASTGVLMSNATLDAEAVSSYDFTIYVTDNTLFSMAHVTIYVIDINDNAPIITSERYLNISESSPIDVIIFNITSTDIDTGKQYIYYIIVQPCNSLYFQHMYLIHVSNLFCLVPYSAPNILHICFILHMCFLWRLSSHLMYKINH